MVMQIHAIGDSIVASYGSDENNFIGGWGDHLHSFFDEKRVEVKVYAIGGRSTRSFLNEGRFIGNGVYGTDKLYRGYGPVADNINSGDYVFIQFGHNDDESNGIQNYIDRITPLGMPDEQGIYPTIVPQENMKKSAADFPSDYEKMLVENGMSEEDIENIKIKYSGILKQYGGSYWTYDCSATYKGYLKFYIDKVRELGAVPVLITPAARQFFKNGRIIPKLGHHGNTDRFGDYPYVRAVRQLGQQENAAVLDLFEMSKSLFELLGEECAGYLQSIKDSDGNTIGEARLGRPAKWVSEYDERRLNHSFAQVDTTHQNRLGSYMLAAMLADSVAEAVPELSDYLLPESSKLMKCPQKIGSRIHDLESVLKNVRINLKV